MGNIKMLLTPEAAAVLQEQARQHIAAYTLGYQQALRDLIKVQTAKEPEANGNTEQKSPQAE
jgi:2-keto-4-pentenoate hydratase/2-oxohepta-3-ene-1,7-dioic acid hydratase in catechol pathway